MDYLTFAKETPVLYGQIAVKGKYKIGAFKPVWSRFSNSLIYQYYTANGRKGTGGFTLMKAYYLFQNSRLFTDPEKGKPENYV